MALDPQQPIARIEVFEQRLNDSVGRPRIGVRLALGGQPRDVIVMILRSSIRVMLVGLVAGICLAIWLARLLQGMWYGVSPADPITLAGSAAVLILAGLAAAWQPALQASRVDPMEILRNE